MIAWLVQTDRSSALPAPAPCRTPHAFVAFGRGRRHSSVAGCAWPVVAAVTAGSFVPFRPGPAQTTQPVLGLHSTPSRPRTAATTGGTSRAAAPPRTRSVSIVRPCFFACSERYANPLNRISTRRRSNTIHSAAKGSATRPAPANGNLIANHPEGPPRPAPRTPRRRGPCPRSPAALAARALPLSAFVLSSRVGRAGDRRFLSVSVTSLAPSLSAAPRLPRLDRPSRYDKEVSQWPP